MLVVGFGSPVWLTRCLEALVDAVDDSTEIILVDNGSEPPLTPVLERFSHRVTALRSEVNLGFGRACNAARAWANGDRILLLNPDAILREGALEALVAHLDADPTRGIVTGRLERPDGSLDPYSCLGAPTVWGEFCFATGLSTLMARSSVTNPEALGGWRRDSERDVGVVTGCVLLTSSELWDELGGFDPRYFMYGEDVDLSARASALGRRLSFVPTVVATHAGGASSTSGAKVVMVLRGKATLARRSPSAVRRAWSTSALRAGVLLRGALEQRRPAHERVWRAAWRARADWTDGWGGAPAQAAAPLIPVAQR
nr:glycosyltransferase family 2 protein [Modestobacter sp. Leaf380]